MNIKQTYCLGCCPMSNIYITVENKKRNPKTKEILGAGKGKCDICGRNKSQILTK